ncbi:MAG: RnfABCDGE type electron transport complex subunit B [Oscillospiraceae bacterium]|jgi:Na+-translocating ferredoxin:NAD+ oxidoreductase RNF subunit RnfB|nr:RnfABCDGE type electron transport complex subunit B [Oscillospiraceae bacterium]
METIITAILITGAIGFLCAAFLAIATKLMYVKTDARVEKLREILPGANCGACGFSSCESYANALVKDNAATNLCPPGGEKVYKEINEVLDKNSGAGLTKKTATVHCLGDCDEVKDKLNYDGINTCFAAKQLYGGQGACTYGCVGFGDCVPVCPSNAICIEKNLAKINPKKCNGCGLCLKVCPTKIISLENEPVDVAVLCKNKEKGAIVKDKCNKGCIACNLCVKACPEDAIEVEEYLAIIDYEKCNGCGKCIEVCIKKCILART